MSIIRRALVGLGAVGITQVAVMPETHHMALHALEGLTHVKAPLPSVEILDMAVTSQSRDSQHAAQLLRDAGAGCIIALGGDGTIRVVSKATGDIPLLPISTGTNNVVPTFVEGTIAGIAAGAVARRTVSLESCAFRHKWLEILVNGQSVDRALVDVAVMRGRFLASRAVWKADDVYHVVVTRADPASIGISAIAGMIRPITATEPVALSVSMEPQADRRIRAAIGPGLITNIGIAGDTEMHVGGRLDLPITEQSLAALDGEREVSLAPGDILSVVLHENGPWIIDAGRAMRELVASGGFTAS